MKLRFLVFFLVPGASFAQGTPSVATSEEVTIERERPKFNDQLILSPAKIRLEKPERDAELGETLSRLPLMTVSSRSGLGSLTSAITATGISSASTSVSIDDVPIMDPIGVGFDFSLIPSALVEGVEYWLPHHQALEPRSQTLVSPSGRVNVRTRRGGKGSPSSGVRKSGSVMLGSGSSVLGSAAVSSAGLSAAVTGFNTKGDYEYKNDLSGAREKRANNSAAGGGGLVSWDTKISETAEARLFGLGSLKYRVNPGSITQPSRDQERDQFALFGGSVREKEFLGPTVGVHALVSGSFSRVAVRTAPPESGGSDRYEMRTLGGFAQVGVEKRFGGVAEAVFDVDEHVDYVRADSGRRNRNINGFSLALPLHVTRSLTVAPWVRQEISDRMPAARDVIFSGSYVFAPQTTATLSYSWLHAYPTITQVAGEHSSYGEILPNDSLKLERSSVWTFAVMHESGPIQFYSLWQYAHVRNRIAFVTLPSLQSQYVNQSDVFVASSSNDIQCSPLSFLGLRAGVTVLRSFDYAQRRELPFKPRVVGLGSVSLRFGRFSIVGEETFWGKRYTQVHGVDSLDPIVQTNVRLAYEAGAWSIALKAANILEESGFDYVGFPIPGRTYWLNLSWDGI